MFLRSTAARLAIIACGGLLAALTATGPAVAAGHHDPAPVTLYVSQASNPHPPAHAGEPGEPPAGTSDNYYWGRVIARTGLLLRSRPNTGAPVVRSVPYGALVPIYCKTISEPVDGNNLWYLLPDGTWAWGAARYIENVGPAPRWC